MKRLVLFWMTILTLGLLGCSNNVDNQSTQNSTPSNNSEESSISITDFSDRTITFDNETKNIIALGNGEVDIIYALGGEVVGRPTTKGPALLKEVDNIAEVGSAHGIDLEKITSLRPDVVLGNHPMNQKDIASIESIGAQMLLTSANSIDDVKMQIQLFGNILQEEDKSKEIIDLIDEKITTIESNRQGEKNRVLLVYGAPGSNMAALPNSLSGNILELAGGINIASDYPKLDNYPQYAQLNAERIIESNPHLILFMGHGNPEVVKEDFIKEMKQNAGWSKLEAVKNNRFEVLPPDLFGTNPGTRVVEALDYLNELFQEMES